MSKQKPEPLDYDLPDMSLEELFNEARGLYQIGAAGDVDASRRALRILEKLYILDLNYYAYLVKCYTTLIIYLITKNICMP